MGAVRRWWGGSWPASLTAVALLAALAPWYGPHGDELYVRALRPAWWYPDQPPLTVWLTHVTVALTDAVAPGEQVRWWFLLRWPAVLAAGAGPLVAAATTRALGHGRSAQRLAAWSSAFTVYPLLVHHVLLTATLDLLAWQLLALAAVRSVRDDPRAPVWGGVVVGLACWNKLLVLVYAAALVAGALVTDRAVLRRRFTLVGGALAGVIGGFPLGAQLVHGLPMRQVSADLVAWQGATTRPTLLPLLVAFLGPPLVVVWWRALVRPWRDDADRPARALGVAALLVLGWNVAVPGQPYYAAAAFVPLLAVGWRAGLARPGGLRRATAIVVANGVVASVLCLPVLPGRWAHLVAAVNPMVADQQGWPDAVDRLAGLVASSSASSPAPPRGVTVVTDHYSLAGAVALYGPQAGLAHVRSGHNGLWSQGPPTTDDVVLVGPRARTEAVLLTRCVTLGELPVEAPDRAGGPVLRCSGPIGGWEHAWPRLRHLGG